MPHATWRRLSFGRAKAGTWIASIALFIFTVAGWSSPAIAQEGGTGVIRGKVTIAETGAALPGANVVISDIQLGTATGVDGRYSIDHVPAGSYTLTATFVGYEESRREVTVAAGDTLTVNFALQQANVGLEELVVIGYGEQELETLTGAVSKITPEEFRTGVAITPLELIQGSVPGLTITRSGNMDPNAGVDIQLRGMTTLTAEADPLIVIDGVPGGRLRNVAPSNIASIEVLRDASAAAIYGARASNGVIIITTKEGRAVTPTVNYQMRVSTQQVTRTPDVLTAEEYVAYAEEMENSAMKDYGAETNWFDELINPYNISHSHTLSLVGGTENTNYRVSANYRNLEGVTLEARRRTARTRANINHIALDDRLSFELNLAGTFSDAVYAHYDAFDQALKRNPTLPVKNDDGSFMEVEGRRYYNPVGRLRQWEDGAKIRYLRASLKSTFAIQSNWDVSARVATTRRSEVNREYVDRNAWVFEQDETNDRVQDRTRTSSESYTQRFFNATTTYNLDLREHHLSGLAGYTYQDYAYEQRTSSRNRLIAFFGRLTYDYATRYLLSATLRREGSSKFGPENKWGWFPAISVGWRLSAEPFMEGVEVVNNLKLRAGFGVTGNQGIPPLQSKARIGTKGVYLAWNDGGYYEWITTYGLDNNPNPILRWEEKHEWNIGLDFGLFGNRLSGSIDVYQRKTTGLLANYSASIPPYVHESIYANVGVMQNRGIEVVLEAIPVQSSTFSWRSDVVLSHNQNELVSLSNDIFQRQYFDTGNLSGASSVGSTVRMQAGHPVGSFYGPEFAGFTEDGRWLFYSAEGEKVTADQLEPEDEQYLGNGMPDLFVSWTNTLSYKNLSLSVFLRGSFLFHILNAKALYYGNKRFLPHNVLKSAITKSEDLNAPVMFSDYYLERGDYIKFDTITLSYTFDLSSDLIREMSVYATGQNLFTITGYSGIDPELDRSGLTPGIDELSYYPPSRTYSVGLNIGL